MTPVTYTNLNKLLLIRDIQEIAKKLISMMIEVIVGFGRTKLLTYIILVM
jgi:hypothetical protein